MSRYEQDGVSSVDELFRRAGYADPSATPTIDPVVRRRRRTRRLLVTGAVVLVLGGLAGGYVAATLTAPLPAATASALTPPDVAAGAPVALALPAEGLSGVTITGDEAYLGKDGVTAANGADTPAPMASISKVITALVVLDAKPLDASGNGPTITFTKADSDLYGAYYSRNAVIEPMPAGSTMSLHDALETMLVISAANYAEAVSTWAYGSQPAFLAAAKRWLTAHGMTHTRMVDPTGLDARNTSTVGDLLILGRLARADPAIAQIVTNTTLDVPGHDARPNTNDLLTNQGIDGIKTGTLEGHGSDLLFSSRFDGGGPEPLTVVGVVLGGADRASVDGDVLALLDSIRAGFHDVPLPAEGTRLGTYSTPWGSSARVVLGGTGHLTTWSDTAVTRTTTPIRMRTGNSGERIGSVTWTAGPEHVTVPILLKGTIRPPDAWWRLTHPGELLGRS